MPGLDPRAARRRFERAARTYSGAARLEAEVGARMLERLDYVKLAPRRVLDAGSGPMRDARALARRYRKADVLAVDFSRAMLHAGRPRLRFFQRRSPKPVCADLARMPFQGGSVGLLWSNMALHWARDPVAALREFHRVLAGDGPCNAERIAARRKAHADGAWVRAAATAHAAKRRARARAREAA